MTGPELSDIRLSSVYVPMSDGVRLAVDVWRSSAAGQDERNPCLLLTTRYWRSLDLTQDDLSRQPMLPLARYFTHRGYAVANVDARGSGASFGVRRTEWSDEEVADIGAVIDWIVAQPWSNGAVFSHGYSYGGNTAFLAACSARPALKAVLPQFADFDLFAHNTFPGGIPNAWLHRNWGRLTAALDGANVAGVAAALPGVDEREFCRYVKGPRPVDGDADGALLRQALAGRRSNFNMSESADAIVFQDDAARLNGDHDVDRCLDPKRLSIYARRDSIERAHVPIVYWAGWFDAGTAEGALDLFASFDNPLHVIIGPWNHGRRYLQDPFPVQSTPDPIALEENFGDIHRHVEACLRGDGPTLGQRRLDYFMLGSNRWCTTTEWPPRGAIIRPLYLTGPGQLSPAMPQHTGRDRHAIDPTATTGTRNRWHTQIGCPPVLHEDRRDEDAKLLVYDSAPLTSALEIVGNPAVHLEISSDRPDVDLFVYLEMITPDGSVRLLTEGCLRSVHRRPASAQPAYRKFQPAHTFERSDASPLEPGVVSTFVLGLLPIAVEVPAGYRLRLAIAGADRDTFAASAGPAATIEVHRSPLHLSRLELPVLAHR